MLPSNREVKIIKDIYKKGMRLKLNKIQDPYPIKSGTMGTVVGVDDAGHILMKWDNGRSLSLIPNVDDFEIVK